jgi:hypothetical protein
MNQKDPAAGLRLGESPSDGPAIGELGLIHGDSDISSGGGFDRRDDSVLACSVTGLGAGKSTEFCSRQS